MECETGLWGLCNVRLDCVVCETGLCGTGLLTVWSETVDCVVCETVWSVRLWTVWVWTVWDCNVRLWNCVGYMRMEPCGLL